SHGMRSGWPPVGVSSRTPALPRGSSERTRIRVVRPGLIATRAGATRRSAPDGVTISRRVDTLRIVTVARAPGFSTSDVSDATSREVRLERAREREAARRERRDAVRERVRVDVRQPDGDADPRSVAQASEDGTRRSLRDRDDRDVDVAREAEGACRQVAAVEEEHRG